MNWKICVLGTWIIGWELNFHMDFFSIRAFWLILTQVIPFVAIFYQTFFDELIDQICCTKKMQRILLCRFRHRHFCQRQVIDLQMNRYVVFLILRFDWLIKAACVFYQCYFFFYWNHYIKIIDSALAWTILTHFCFSSKILSKILWIDSVWLKPHSTKNNQILLRRNYCITKWA